MSADHEAPWAKAWRAWSEAAAKGFPAGAGQAFTADPSEGLVAAFQHFARAIESMMKHSGGEHFARRFVDMLAGAARHGSGASGDEFLSAMLASMPRALLGAFPDAGAGKAWLQWSATSDQWAEELLALPAIGPQREWQEMLKAVQRAVLGERRTRATLDEHHRLAIRSALSRLAAALEDHSAPPIHTVRALYDLWIDEAEAAYAERVMGDAYAQDFAAWVNAGSTLRLAIRTVGTRLGALLDVPGRDEIDALLARQQAMQRELTALRAEREQGRADVVADPAVPQTEVANTVDKQGGVSTSNRTARSAPKTSTPRPRADKPQVAKRASPARGKPAAARPSKAARAEFDISHILDSGK